MVADWGEGLDIGLLDEVGSLASDDGELSYEVGRKRLECVALGLLRAEGLWNRE